MLSCGTKFTISNLLGEKSTYLISDYLFLDKERVLEIKEASKNIKYRPEFPKNLNRYSFMEVTKEGNIRIMQLNETRHECIDIDILEAIKRGEHVDPRTFTFY